jgi:hypothetical protein
MCCTISFLYVSDNWVLSCWLLYELVDVSIYLVYVSFVFGDIAVLCFCMLWLCMKLYIRVY